MLQKVQESINIQEEKITIEQLLGGHTVGKTAVHAEDESSICSANRTARDASTEGKKESIFLNLPAELRNAIYAFSFENNHSYGFDTAEGEPLQYLLLPPLTQVSRQLREESIPVFFQVTRFTIWVGCDAQEREQILAHRAAKACNLDEVSPQEELTRLSQLCGKSGVCPRAANILLKFQERISIRCIEINIIPASSLPSLQKWLPQRIAWMRKHGRYHPPPETMWETKLECNGRETISFWRTGAFPSEKERDFSDLRWAAACFDGVYRPRAKEVTRVFGAPDGVVEGVMRDVRAAAERVGVGVGRVGFSLEELRGVVRKYRVEAPVRRRGHHCVERKGVRTAMLVPPSWGLKGRRKKHVDEVGDSGS